MLSNDNLKKTPYLLFLEIVEDFVGVIVFEK